MKKGSAKNKGSRIINRATRQKVVTNSDVIDDFDDGYIKMTANKFKPRKMIPLADRVSLYSRALGGMINYDGSMITDNKHFQWVGDEGQAHKMIAKNPDLQLTIKRYLPPAQAISYKP